MRWHHVSHHGRKEAGLRQERALGLNWNCVSTVISLIVHLNALTSKDPKHVPGFHMLYEALVFLNHIVDGVLNGLASYFISEYMRWSTIR